MKRKLIDKIKIWLAILPYSAINFFALGLIASIAMGGFWSWAGLSAALMLILLLEMILGDIKNEVLNPPRWYFELQLLCALPLLVLATLIAFNTVAGPIFLIEEMVQRLGFDPVLARESTKNIDRFFIFINVGVLYAYLGINVAHELCHRNSVTYHLVAKWLLAFSCGTGFAIEHVGGHHRNVGTELDPATAYRGEAFYSFLFRSVVGQAMGAYSIECRRLRLKGEKKTIVANRFVRGQMMSMLILMGYVFFMGLFYGLIFYFVAVAIAKMCLEYANYVEHYGLVRVTTAPVEQRHSWNCYRRISCYLLYNLPIHSCHHRFPTRPFWSLQAGEVDGPTLPFGYVGMFLLALYPPIWKKFTHPLLANWDQNSASDAELRILASRERVPPRRGSINRPEPNGHG